MPALFAMPPSSRQPKKRVREDQVSLLDFNETNRKMDGGGIERRYAIAGSIRVEEGFLLVSRRFSIDIRLVLFP